MTIPIVNKATEKKMKLDRKAKREILRISAHIGSLSMLAVLLWRFRAETLGRDPLRDFIVQLGEWSTDLGAHSIGTLLLQANQWSVGLGADPVRELLLQTGEWSIGLLILSLAITPVVMLTGWKNIMPWRRIFGVYAFVYVALHLAVFVWLDYGLNIQFIIEGIIEQNFVLVGFLAFLLLIPLAVTSNKWSMKRLGKKWKSLHKLVFVIIILALIHFFWLVKNVYYVPIAYASVVAILLALRWKPIKQRAIAWKNQRRNRKNAKKAI